MSLRVPPGLAWTAYAGLMRALLPLALLRLAWRARQEPLYGTAWAERLGCGEGSTPGAVWLHAVSLGETRAAEPLIQALRHAWPEVRLLLTHGTATGRETGRALLRPGDAQRWLPLDTPGATRRFLARHRPCVGLLMETEVWPALLRAAQQAKVPVLLVNARLSEKSLRKSLRLDALLRPAVASLQAVLAQTAADAQRFEQAGATRVEVLGNLKFDLQPDPELMARGQRWRQGVDRPVVLAASWREGEDEPLLQAWADFIGRWRVAHRALPVPLLLWVPRHPQRFDTVAGMIEHAGLSLSRRSQWGLDATAQPPLAAAQVDVWLGDSLREMPAYYACADAALLGGSFAPLGGQNLIEAAACGCPLVMGPHTFNFADAARGAVEAGAAQQVPDLGAALAVVERWLCEAQERQRAAVAARQFAQAHQGAAARTAACVLSVAAPTVR